MLAIPSLARADLDRLVGRLGPDIQLELLHGYPLSHNLPGGSFTFGLELTNSAEEREVRVAISGELSYEQTLRVPARERRRWFAYLPMRQDTTPFCILTLTDLATGDSKTIELEHGSRDEMQLARLGPLTSALNVEKPFTLVGALDGFMPDDWRGLTGLRVIVMEHAYAVTQPPNWPVLIDWVAAGGILVISTPLPSLNEPLPITAPLLLQTKVEEQIAGLVQRVGVGMIARVYPQQLETVNADFLQHLGPCPDCGWKLEIFRAQDMSRLASSRLASAVRPPGWSILGVLVAFAFVAGPGAYMRFMIRRRRPLVYLGVAMAASLAFSVLVMLVELVHNGVSSRVIPHSVIMVDQRADQEVGVEEIAAHVPFGAGLSLQDRPGLQLLLPRHRGDRDDDALDERAEARGVSVVGAVPARARRVVGARWIGRAQGKLIVQLDPSGLAVENHFGRDLENIALWHDGTEYALRSLRRGQRGIAAPVSHAEVYDRTEQLVRPFTAAAANLLRRVALGKISEYRYLAEIGWDRASSGVLEATAHAYRPGRHVIAGIYR
jgi:hypothetical protein